MSHYLGQDQQESRGRRRAVLLTGRGAVVVMLAVFALGVAAGSWLDQTVAAGIAYLVGCVAAARYTKPADLLVVSVSPPLLYFCALTAVTIATAGGGTTLSAVGGAALTFAGTAPWLFAGTALALVIAWFRGLPGCVRDLRRQLRSDLRAPAPRGTSVGQAPRRR